MLFCFLSLLSVAHSLRFYPSLSPVSLTTHTDTRSQTNIYTLTLSPSLSYTFSFSFSTV